MPSRFTCRWQKGATFRLFSGGSGSRITLPVYLVVAVAGEPLLVYLAMAGSGYVAHGLLSRGGSMPLPVYLAVAEAGICRSLINVDPLSLVARDCPLDKASDVSTLFIQSSVNVDFFVLGGGLFNCWLYNRPCSFRVMGILGMPSFNFLFNVLSFTDMAILNLDIQVLLA